MKHTILHLLTIGAPVILMVLMLELIYIFSGGTTPAGPQPIRVTSTAECPVTDSSFCSMAASISRYVGQKDASDILENQNPVAVVCPTNQTVNPACQGVESRLVVQTFPVYVNGNYSVLTRNNYIAYFQIFFDQYAPFRQVGLSAGGGNAVMRFDSERTPSTRLQINFTKQGSTWKITFPTTGTL